MGALILACYSHKTNDNARQLKRTKFLKRTQTLEINPAMRLFRATLPYNAIPAQKTIVSKGRKLTALKRLKSGLKRNEQFYGEPWHLKNRTE